MITAPPRRSPRPWPAFAAAALLSLVAATAQAADQAQASAPAQEALASAVVAAPADLVVFNRPITTLRAEVFGATPAERVETISRGLDAVLERGGPLVVSTHPIPEGIALQVDGHFLFRILHDDVNREAGESAQAAADAAARNLQRALEEIRASGDSATMLRAAGYTVLATLALAALLVRGGERVASLNDAGPASHGRLGYNRVARSFTRNLPATAASLPPKLPLPRFSQIVLAGDWLGEINCIER
jgi:hypothetical protein